MSNTTNDADSLIESLRQLRTDLERNPNAWQNTTLDDYLESIAAWLEDSKERLPEQPSWEFVAGLFSVGKIYE